MDARDWYYLDDRVDPESPVGPVSLSRLSELIRLGDLPYDVLVSTESSLDADWVEADRLKQVLDAVPLDRERLMRKYIAYGEAPRCQEHWGWASERMYSVLESNPGTCLGADCRNDGTRTDGRVARFSGREPARGPTIQSSSIS